MTAMRILGVDPGSQITGYGIIDSDGRDSRLVACGSIRLARTPLPARLGRILQELSQVIALHQPQQAAVEQVFMSQNPKSALVLGHARGAALCAVVQAGLEVSEYATRLVKQAVVGYGGADKTQVQHMVRRLLNLDTPLQADAADALAVALCHAHAGALARRTARFAEALSR